MICNSWIVCISAINPLSHPLTKDQIDPKMIISDFLHLSITQESQRNEILQFLGYSAGISKKRGSNASDGRLKLIEKVNPTHKTLRPGGLLYKPTGCLYEFRECHVHLY